MVFEKERSHYATFLDLPKNILNYDKFAAFFIFKLFILKHLKSTLILLAAKIDDPSQWH